MTFFNACTFAHGSPRGFTQSDAWKRSLDAMLETTLCDTVLLPVAARQDHAYSTQVEYDAPDVMSPDDVRSVAAYVREKGKRLILKAMVNPRDGYWRAYIRFFDSYVPTEPTWEQWFSSYQAYVWQLAQLAEELGAEMLCVGCEMVGTDHREQEWRALVAGVRARYQGAVTYNCDKYQEGNVRWWDCLDYISSSGYYPVTELDAHFARIHEVSQRVRKPFLFMECGCPSRNGSEHVPNNWSFGGAQDNESQRLWYEAFAKRVIDNPWICGVGWWDWSAMRLYPVENGATDSGYCVYGKPAAEQVRRLSQAVNGRALIGGERA